MTFACAEGEVFDVEAEMDRQPLSVRPGVVRTVNDRRVSIAIMIWKLHIGIPAKLGSAPLAHTPRGTPAEDPMMVGAATVFVVTDIAKSTEHYRDVLGCAVTFEFGTPAFYVGLCRNEVALHLLSASQTSRLSGNGGICVFVKGCRCRLRRIGGARSQDRKPPQNYDYDMRDFDLIDLNGNRLTFEMGSPV
jgi:hypothetical protein